MHGRRHNRTKRVGEIRAETRFEIGHPGPNNAWRESYRPKA